MHSFLCIFLLFLLGNKRPYWWFRLRQKNVIVSDREREWAAMSADIKLHKKAPCDIKLSKTSCGCIDKNLRLIMVS